MKLISFFTLFYGKLFQTGDDYQDDLTTESEECYALFRCSEGTLMQSYYICRIILIALT